MLNNFLSCNLMLIGIKHNVMAADKNHIVHRSLLQILKLSLLYEKNQFINRIHTQTQTSKIYTTLDSKLICPLTTYDIVLMTSGPHSVDKLQARTFTRTS